MRKEFSTCLTLFALFSTLSFSQMKYTSSGNLGIGTTTPSSTVNIHGSSEMLEFSNTSETQTGILFYDHGYESYQFAKILFDCSGTNRLRFYFRHTTIPNFELYNQLITRFHTRGEEYSPYTDNGIQFDNAGYGQMSTISPVTDWAGNLGSSSKEWATLYCDHIYYSQITQQPCDINFKSNVRDVKDPLQKINAIRGVQYNLTEEYYKDADDKLKQVLLEDKKDIYGFIAQELELVIPELVTRSDSGQYGVNMIGFIPILVEAIKA